MTENSLEIGHDTFLVCQLQAQKIPGYLALHKRIMPYANWETISMILVRWKEKKTQTSISFCTYALYKTQFPQKSYFLPLLKYEY